ncbi:MAG: apolipoprotein N-acyltransferase, partial [Endomicrobia bacterium]|nr:apolipoprotein N-acyltransferase [Endomicrobiia bacterium]
FFLIWIGFIPFFFLLFRTKPLGSLMYAFIAGYVFNMQANFWLIDTVYLFTDRYIISVICYMCFCAYFAVYWGIWGWLSSIAAKYFSNTWIFIIVSSCLWVIVEYVRANILTGWPWLIAGYSQYRFTQIIQIAEFTGVYGVSFLIMFVNGLLYFGIVKKKKAYFVVAAAAFIAAFAFGASRSAKFKNFGGREFSAAIMQSNVEQYKKLDNSYRNEMLSGLEDFASKLHDIKADINVWSESEIINLIPADFDSYVFADKIAKEAGGFNMLGAPYLGGDGRLFNAVFYFNGKGGYVAMHSKNHLVPFGEYMPFGEEFSKLLGVPNINDDITRGTDTNVFTDGEIFAGPLICSENFFPDIVRRFVFSGAKVLTNHINDAWFMDSSAPHKHFCVNIFRAIESRKAVLVAADTGVSAIIDASGTILASTKVYERAILTGVFRQNDYITFYMRYGDVFMKLCILFVLFCAAVILRQRTVRQVTSKK